MAAVGCNPMERKDMGEKTATKLTLSCKRNGFTNGCYCEDKMETRNNCRSQLFDKLLRFNGSPKTNNNNCFPRPSVPSLRSRRERHSSGTETAKRRRRSSRHDSGDNKLGESPGNDVWTPSTPDTPDSLEVAKINQNCCIVKHKFTNSVPHTKDIAELLPLVNGTLSGTNGHVPVVAADTSSRSNGHMPVTPDTSRSCTPVSIGGHIPSPVCSPIGSPLGKGDTTPSKETAAASLLVECQWKDCEATVNNGEIMDHIRAMHVQSQKEKEKVVCLWIGCKVYNKPASSKSWLDRHILSHSGDKPFRCIVAGCGARFTSQGGLERHVNSHFNAQEQSPNQKHSKQGREDTPTKLFKRKRLKPKRNVIKVKTEDYFDPGIMTSLHNQLNVITERTQLDLNGSNNAVTFHSTVIARRKDASGKAQFLLQWTPRNIIPDEWVSSESQVQFLHSRSIPTNCLPRDSLVNLHPALYHQHRYRKHRRK